MLFRSVAVIGELEARSDHHQCSKGDPRRTACTGHSYGREERSENCKREPLPHEVQGIGAVYVGAATTLMRSTG